jgi:hypothetical protein
VTPQASDFGIGLSPLVSLGKNLGYQQSEIAVILEVAHVIRSRSANVAAAHLCAKYAAPCRSSILHFVV